MTRGVEPIARPLLIAGVGNVFFGDDAFGCEVIRRLLLRHPRPGTGIRVRDFGVSTRNLAYALAAENTEHKTKDGAGVVLIVDAVATGAAVGTLQLFDLASDDVSAPCSLSHHSLDVAGALAAARILGAAPPRTYLLGCEPQSLEPRFTQDGPAAILSPKVETAAGLAVDLLARLMTDPDRDVVRLCTS